METVFIWRYEYIQVSVGDKIFLVNTYLIVEVYFSFGVKVCPFGLLFSLGFI